MTNNFQQFYLPLLSYIEADDLQGWQKHMAQNMARFGPEKDSKYVTHLFYEYVIDPQMRARLQEWFEIGFEMTIQLGEKVEQ